MWKLVDQLLPIKDMNVRAMTFAAKLDDARRAELHQALQRINDRRLILAVKLALGKVTAPVLSDFGVWLVLQGRVAFEKAVADPDTLADFDSLGRVEACGRFTFDGPTRGDKWTKEEARRRLKRMIAKHVTGPKPDGPTFDAATAAPPPEEQRQVQGRSALLRFLRELFAAPGPRASGDCFVLEPSTIGDIHLVSVTEGPAFGRPPPDPALHLLWEAMRGLQIGEMVAIEGIGSLSKSERPGFTAFDPRLGRERLVPEQRVYKLRLVFAP
ncbi:MAG: DUF4240 domain-containing protein [Alphaproteobacteria bacterium]|nr:DUF4240 domain-containing protein [Alphaproteobacteria bacterium]